MNDDLKKKKPNSLIIGMIGAIIGGVIVGVLLLGVNFFDSNSVIQGAKNEIIVNQGSADTVVEAIAQTVPPSVVGIETTGVSMTVYGPQEASGVGSGFILTSDGYIGTNQHVASDDVSALKVPLADGIPMMPNWSGRMRPWIWPLSKLMLPRIYRYWNWEIRIMWLLENWQ